MINIKVKKALMAVPFLVLISCSDVEELAWDATNYTYYNEFMECTPGENFSDESLIEMIAEWRDIGLSESLLGSWGYAPASENNTLTNREWELSWSSREAADQGWSEWLANKDAQAWTAKYSSVLQCDGENRKGYEFIFPYDPYKFGPTAEDGSFAANFMPCNLNEGQAQADLSSAIIEYNEWLDSLDKDAVGGFYAYGIYLPVDITSEFDYWYGNFHLNMDGMKVGMSLWEETGGEAKDAIENTGSCLNPEIFQGQVFYDPTKPDFS